MRAGVAVMAAVAVAASGTASARERPASPPEPFGVNAGILWLDGLSQLPADLHTERMGREGVRTVRQLAVWNEVEPRAPNSRTGAHDFHWESTDAIARRLALNGIRWTVILGLSTPWGGEVPGTTGGPPRVGPFTDYAQAVARRYGRHGRFWRDHPDVPYLPVTTYQVWNEPNIPGSVTGIGAASYATLYAHTRAAVLDADPHARVAVGALAHSTAERGSASALDYLEAMFRARPDLRGRVDALALTIYRPSPTEVLEQVAAARATLDAVGERTTPIDIAETGWTTSGSALLTGIIPVTDAVRGELLRDLVTRVAAADCGVASMTPYAWVTPEDNAVDAAAWFGLADRRSATLRPSGGAYTQAARTARDAGRATDDVCARPDLPRLLELDASRRRADFTARLSRACSRRTMTVRWTLGPDLEPFARVEMTLPRGRPRTYRDPDGGGPRTAPTSVTLRIPRRTGTVRLVARDELGRKRGVATTRLRACPSRRTR